MLPFMVAGSLARFEGFVKKLNLLLRLVNARSPPRRTMPREGHGRKSEYVPPAPEAILGAFYNLNSLKLDERVEVRSMANTIHCPMFSCFPFCLNTCNLFIHHSRRLYLIANWCCFGDFSYR
jgi:hypothetical protein